MKKLLVYDSYFGNTKQVAQGIANNLAAKIIKASNVKISDLDKIEMLIIGSPTRGGRASEEVQKFLENIPEGALKNVKVAAFDTRISEKDINFALRILVKTIGYAAPKLADILISKGGELVISPEGFIVKGKEGPLLAGEIERATGWIKL